jgi:hypothetical protein
LGAPLTFPLTFSLVCCILRVTPIPPAPFPLFSDGLACRRGCGSGGRPPVQPSSSSWSRVASCMVYGVLSWWLLLLVLLCGSRWWLAVLSAGSPWWGMVFGSRTGQVIFNKCVKISGRCEVCLFELLVPSSLACHGGKGRRRGAVSPGSQARQCRGDAAASSSSPTVARCRSLIFDAKGWHPTMPQMRLLNIQRFGGGAIHLLHTKWICPR